jgi:outer membrane protein OmpA-like peptidoglycan-associated protein
MRSVRIAFAFALALTPIAGFAQQQRAAIASSDVLSQISMFNYQGKSSLELRPTPIVSTGGGDVDVDYRDGNARIDVKVKDLPPPSKLGPYTCYVLWALTPDGRAANQGVLGEVEGGKAKLNTQYSASQFALIVTAEPHFAVTAPSNMIVLYNVGAKVRGTETKVTSLTERSDYSHLTPIAVSKTKPPELVAAEYSVALAAAAGADKYATNLYSGAQQKLTAAQAAAAASKSSERKQAPALARTAVIAGEDARREAMSGKAAAETAAAQAAAAKAAADSAAAAAATETAIKVRAAASQDLLKRLNQALPTRETDRGLVSEIGGVQFATGTADLNSTAREGLARLAGVVASYPDLKFKVEGHTDNVGSDENNNVLSLRRAIAVRDYLIGQHVAASGIDAEGLGSTHPIADNETNDGRARNRRVEIVITGGPLSTTAAAAN